jgi:uncharacterized membrane protein YdcZ (DUF606 family)
VSISLGATLVVQAVIQKFNGVLFNSFLWASALSFSMGCLLLNFVMACKILLLLYLKTKPLASIWTFKSKPAFRNYLPAILGLTYVIASVVATKYLGFSLFFVAIVVGQLVSGAYLDHAGFSRPMKIPLDLSRSLILMLALIGAVLSVMDSISSTSDFSLSARVLSFVFAFTAGSFLPLQVGLNREMVKHTGSMTKTLYIMFSIATLLLITAITVESLVVKSLMEESVPNAFATLLFWNYAPGFMGVFYIFISIRVTSMIGNAAFFISLVLSHFISSFTQSHCIIDENLNLILIGLWAAYR